MDRIEKLDYIQTLVFESEHSAATIEEAYKNVCEWLDQFEAI